MKKSNKISLLLLVVMCILPLIVHLIISLTGNNSYIGISENCQVVVINNPDLQAESVRINTKKSSYFPYREALEVNNRTYVYYQGDKQYYPEMSLLQDTLYINGTQEKVCSLQ